MKGTEDFVWMLGFLFICVLVAASILIFFSKPISATIDEATRLQSKYLSYQIAGIVSLAQSGDDGIETKFDLPSNPVKIEISSISVHVEFSKQNSYTHHFTEYEPLKTKIELVDYIKDPKIPVEVENIVIESKDYSSIILKKIGGKIIIKATHR